MERWSTAPLVFLRWSWGSYRRAFGARREVPTPSTVVRLFIERTKRQITNTSRLGPLKRNSTTPSLHIWVLLRTLICSHRKTVQSGEYRRKKLQQQLLNTRETSGAKFS